MRRVSLVVMVALVAVACGASTTQTQDLRLAYHKGDFYKYAIHSTANQTIDLGTIGTFPINVDMKANETVTVKSVDPTGTADLSIDLTNLSMSTSMSGTASTTTVPSQTITMQVGADGRIVSVNGSGVGSNPFTILSGVGGGFISAVLPDKAAQRGDTWSKSYDQANPLGSGSIHVTADSKYVKDEGKLAVIETTSNGAIDITLDMTKLAAGQSGSTIPGLIPGSIQSISFKGTVKAIVTSWIDPSTHRVSKTHRTSKIDSTMTMNFPTGSSTAIPGLTGPINIKGDETTDLTSA